MLDEVRMKTEELLQQARRCEASLSRARIDLAALRTDAPESSVEQVLQALRRTVDQAKAVQAEIKRLGY